MEKLKKVYSLMDDKSYTTAKFISSKLNISTKTVRNIIKELNEYLKNDGIYIISTPRHGYILSEKRKIDFKIKNKIPITKKERIEYLAEKMIFDYIKIEDISPKIYVSTKTISNDLKEIDEIIKKYELKFDKKPYYGIKIVGEEINIRKFLINLYIKKLDSNKDIENMDVLNKISNSLRQVLVEKHINMSDIRFQNLVMAIYISYLRNDRTINIEYDNLEKKEIVEEFLNSIDIKLSDENIKYITMYLLANENLKFENNNDEKEIKKIIEDLFFYIDKTFKIKLDINDRIYTNLYTHLLSLVIRIRFNISVENPLLESIKENMILEYHIATYISNLLKKMYGKQISEDEIAYLAIIFSLSSKIRKKQEKKRVLLICSAGRGISNFLKYTYENLFSEYIDIVDTLGVNELKKYDVSDIDYIFTVVDLDKEYGPKTYKINYFIDDIEKENINKMLNKRIEIDINSIFSEKLFMVFEDITKDEVIKIMSDKVKKEYKIDKDIYKLIIEREKLGFTEICKQVGIPHPIEVLKGLNKIGVCIFKKPIIWNDNHIDIALFIFIENVTKNREIYKLLNNMISKINTLNKDNITYKKFIKFLKGDENEL